MTFLLQLPAQQLPALWTLAIREEAFRSVPGHFSFVHHTSLMSLSSRWGKDCVIEYVCPHKEVSWSVNILRPQKYLQVVAWTEKGPVATRRLRKSQSNNMDMLVTFFGNSSRLEGLLIMPLRSLGFHVVSFLSQWAYSDFSRWTLTIKYLLYILQPRSHGRGADPGSTPGAQQNGD